MTLDHPAYPSRRRRVDLPPPVLLVRGDVDLLAAPRTVAIVGTRRPSERGRLVAARIAAAVSGAGAVVVSGLAVGIDGAAHAAVVAHEGPTIAVLGSGHDRLYLALTPGSQAMSSTTVARSCRSCFPTGRRQGPRSPSATG